MPDGGRKKSGSGDGVTEAVMKDKVVKEAIRHSGEEPAPSRVAEKKKADQATQSETSLRTSGQRKINLLWELTQAVVTIMVVYKTLDVAGELAVGSSSDRTVAFLLMSNAFFMIVTFYYQRTNHVRTGGIGGRDVDTDR